MSESPVDLLRQAAEAAKNVLPVAIATLIVSEIKNSGPHIKWWDDGDELGEHWRCLTCDEPMEPTEWRRGCECIGWLFAREVLALAEQQQTAGPELTAEQVAYIKAATLQEEANWWEQVRPTTVGRTQFGTWLRGRADVHLRAAGIPVQKGEQ